MSTNSGLGASVTGTLDSSVTTVAGVSFVSVCSSGLSVTNVYLYRLTLKFCSGNRMGEGLQEWGEHVLVWSLVTLTDSLMSVNKAQ